MGAGGAFQDGVLEAFIVLLGPGAGGWCVLVEPGSVGGQVIFPGTHLVDPPHYELPQSHEGVWGEAGGVGVVGGSGVFSRLFLEE